MEEGNNAFWSFMMVGFVVFTIAEVINWLLFK